MMLPAEPSELTNAAEIAAPAETSAEQPAWRKRRRWPWVVAAGLIGIASLIVFAPQIVARSDFRHELPRFRLIGFKEEIHVGRASLSWWGPIELYDVQLKAPDGKTFAAIKKSTEYRGVWDILFHPEELVRTRLDEPVFTVLLRADGSNVDDAMAPVLNHPKRKRSRAIDIAGGIVRVTDTTNGRAAEWQDLALHAENVSDESSPGVMQLTAKATAKLADAPQADPLEVDFSCSTDPNHANKPSAPWTVTITTGNLPLQAFGPLLSRYAPDLELSGSVTTHLHLKSGQSDASPAGPQIDADWDLATTDFIVDWPSRLGNTPLTLGTTKFEGAVSFDESTCHVERFELATGVGRLDGKGTIPWKIFAAKNDNISDDRPAERPIVFALRGEVDLVGLSRLSPQSLPWREGIELTEGKVTFDVASRSRQEGPAGAAAGRIKLGPVASRRNGWRRKSAENRSPGTSP